MQGKAPGAMVMIFAGAKLLPITGNPNTVPTPKASLTEPKITNAIVKPNPIPTPSTIEPTAEFLEAKDSALAKIKQLTTIRGIKIPNAASNAGKKAFNNIPTIVTKVAMITTKQGIRILPGIKILN
jgi:hypothetical protein